MPEDKLRIGIIGVGSVAMGGHVPALRSTPRAEITAICRRSVEQLRMAQEHLGVEQAHTDWREMLDKADIDAVIVCTPPDLHAEPTLAALQRGLHVLVEKPMALTFQEAWSMVEAAKRAERVLMVSYGFKLYQKWRAVKAALDQGRIGPIRQVSKAFTAYRGFFWLDKVIPEAWREGKKQRSGMPAEFYGNWSLEGDWKLEPERSGGGMFADMGSHLVDLALWLGGAPPAEVVAFSESAGWPVERFVSVQARLKNDVLLSLVSADANPGSVWHMNLLIIGDQGVVTLDPEETVWIEADGIREKLASTGDYQPPATAFVECILDGKPNPSPGDEGAYTTAFIEAAYQSAAEGRIVKLKIPS